jgi:acetylornithine deacetylase/succinyl-diaminopimelate desuccinylase-like protein
VVPDRCTLELDRRMNPGETAESARDEVAEAVSAVRRRLPWLDVDVTVGSEYLPFELAGDDGLVTVVAEAMKAAGLEPRTGVWRAASDAGFFVKRAGIPCVLFGPGDIAAAHRPDEFVDLEQVESAREVVSRLLLAP